MKHPNSTYAYKEDECPGHTSISEDPSTCIWCGLVVEKLPDKEAQRASKFISEAEIIIPLAPPETYH